MGTRAEGGGSEFIQEPAEFASDEMLGCVRGGRAPRWSVRRAH